MPPLLIGATLLFWGWQTQLLYAAVPMALVLEGARFSKIRWEFSNDELARIWTFCMVLLLAAMVFAFNYNGGPSSFSELFQSPNVTSEGVAGKASTLTADAIIRWLPMIFFLFIAAQVYSPVGTVPLEAVSLYLRSRMKRARKKGHPLPPSRRFDALYPYFALCLFSSSARADQGDNFYYGLCILLGWALWPSRSRRFSVSVWVSMLALAFFIGYWGQHTFTQLSSFASKFDPQLLSYFWHPRTDPRDSITDLGKIGDLKLSGRIVIRLEPENGAQVPAYLREAGYRKLDETKNHFGEQLFTWDSGFTNDDLPQVYETPRDSGIWPLNGNPANRAMVNIACYLDSINPNDKYPEGVLPLPADCNRLEHLKAYFVYQNNIGAVLAEGPRLVMFDARFGSGIIKDAPPGADTYVTNEDLLVPPNEVPALTNVISRLNVDGKSDDDKIEAVAKFFANNFRYSLWQRKSSWFSNTNQTPLSRFLLVTHRGHCEFFATATVLLLRQLGIPARYAVGYYVHEPSGKGYVVRLRDAHAWCLVWKKNKNTWAILDTTPGTWVAQEEEHASPFQFLSDFQSWIEFEALKLFEYDHNNIREYLFWVLIPALAFLLYRIFRGGRRQDGKGEKSERPAWPGLDSEFYRLEQKLAQGGLPRQPGESLALWLQRATNDSHFSKLKQPLENVLALHYRYRFDPRGLNPAERQNLRREVEACLAAASGNSRN